MYKQPDTQHPYGSKLPINVPIDVTKTILVVDDELPVVDIVEAILEYAGYQVLTAGDGREALACLDKHKVDLVLSDMMMPVMDGRELCKRIEAHPEHRAIPIVLMSATHSAARLDGCKHAAFVQKPFDTTGLLTAVEAILGR